MNQGAGQYLILNDDDEKLSNLKPASGVSVLRYGMGRTGGRHAFVEDGALKAFLEGEKPSLFDLRSFSLPGTHNIGNLMPVVLTGMLLGVDPGLIQKNIDEFKGLANRLQWVSEIKGVAFYNDSKATNVDAAVRAVGTFDRQLILIAGGRHKGADYGALAGASLGRVRHAVFIGEARDLLAESFKGKISFETAESMEQAVTRAFHRAEPGDAVLLAPACSSFDMFTDYSHRGQVFRRSVEMLENG
jgi:UDP-N-acetylmuramoylalanine--D-glutamate ligase